MPDNVYIYDGDEVKIQIQESNDVVTIIGVNEYEQSVIEVIEPGPQGPRGNDGGEYIPPANIVSSSAQIASDISGSFVSASNSLSNRIGVFESKTLYSSSQQVNFTDISGSFSTSSFLQNNFTSSYNLFTSSIETKVQRLESVTSSFVVNSATSSLLNNTYSASADLRIGRLEAVTSSYAIKTEVSGAFTSVSASLAGRITTYDNKTLVSGSSQITYSQISGIPSGILSSSNGLISGSSQVDFSLISNKPTLFSGSAQVLYSGISNVPSNIVSGSEQLTGSYDARYERRGSGLLSSSQQINNLIPNIITSSAQIAGDISGSFIALSGSLSNRVYSIEQTTGSLNAFTGSLNNRFVSIERTTGSLNVFTASIQSEVNNLKAATGSYERTGRGVVSSSQQINILIPNIVSSSAQIASDISGSFIALSGSFNNRLVSIEATTGSFNTFTGSANNRLASIELTTGSLNLATGSILSRLASLELTSGSLNASTASILSRVASIELTTGSLNAYTGSANTRFGNIEIKTGSYATTGSNIFVGNQTISGSLTLSGSVYLVSGSFSGSHRGDGSGLTGVVVTLPTGILSSSAQIASDISGSFVALSGSLANRVYSIELTTGSLNTFTGSIQSQVSSILQTTGSLNIATGSIISRIASIELVTGSLNTYTGSASSRFNLIEIKTGSYATTGSNTFIGTEIVSGSIFITGSLQVDGQVSGSFVGNGSGLTGIVATAIPAGPDQSVQFNDGGATSGSSDLLFDKTLKILKVMGTVSASAFQGDGSQLTNIGGGVSKAFVLAMAAAL
tara:strand:+ start:2581 stop:4965 length:2385 start_codon:yes stop_codon:yes gene_type:complete